MYNIKSIQIVPITTGKSKSSSKYESCLKTETWELNLKLTSWQAHDLVSDTELQKSVKGKEER